MRVRPEAIRGHAVKPRGATREDAEARREKASEGECSREFSDDFVDVIRSIANAPSERIRRFALSQERDVLFPARRAHHPVPVSWHPIMSHSQMPGYLRESIRESYGVYRY